MNIKITTFLFILISFSSIISIEQNMLPTKKARISEYTHEYIHSQENIKLIEEAATCSGYNLDKNIKILNDLVNNGFNINKVLDDLKGDNALTLAARFACIEIIRELLKLGADVNFQNRYDGSVLIIVIKLRNNYRHDNFEVLNLLLNQDSINLETKINACDGNTALMELAHLGKHLDVFKLLLEKKADINAKNNKHETALEFLCYKIDDPERFKMFELLFKYSHLDVNNISMSIVYPPTALLRAIGNGKNNLVACRMLLQRGTNPNHLSPKTNITFCKTPLIKAIKIKSIDMIHLLLEFKVDVNFPDAEKVTPLMHAVSERNMDIAKLLIFAGADIFLKDENEKTVLDYCKTDKDRQSIQDWYKEYKSAINSMLMEQIPIRPLCQIITDYIF